VRKVLTLAIMVALAVALGAGAPSRPAAAAKPKRPNVVFILTDDLSWDLVKARFAPHIARLRKRGETFTRYFVSDSLCCPSRSSIFTGLFPHDSKVFTNGGTDGGFAKFQSQGLDKRTFATAIQPAGYLTSMLGKYLNGYGDPQMAPQATPVPPGWSDWHVSNATGYAEFNYLLNDNGAVHFYGGPTGTCGATGTPDNYGVDVLNADARSFIQRAGSKPFVMEVATFAPHAPYTPAERNACDFPGLTAPTDPSFDRNNVDPPNWLGHRKPLTGKQIAHIDLEYRKRAQSVEAVDKLLADVESTLRAEHRLNNTYIVFSSDNGYHLGQHRLLRGKQTAFDTDIRVPLIVAGPGVPHGKTVRKVTQNVDLYPTFVQLAGSKPAKVVDGHSLVPLLHPGKNAPRWRTAALVEHHGPDTNVADPDFEAGKGGGNPTTYEAMRISTRELTGFRGPVEAVYVEYADGEREYYDIRKDPFERHNVASHLTARQKRTLHHALAALQRCRGASSCWKAGLPR
jgi:N-acetylglucosamine-6-sulfatase